MSGICVWHLGSGFSGKPQAGVVIEVLMAIIVAGEAGEDWPTDVNVRPAIIVRPFYRPAGKKAAR